MERKNTERKDIHIFERTAVLFRINYIYTYTAQTAWESWKFMHNIALCISRKLRSWSQNACSRWVWFREKEIYSEHFQVNPRFYEKHHEPHLSATSAYHIAWFIRVVEGSISFA